MCHFVSWKVVNKVSSNPHKPQQEQILFLTDKEVFSARGRRMLRENDALGHGAIYDYFDLKGKLGVDHEEQQIWAPELFPPEIAECLRNFDANFGRMFSSGCFQNDDLTYIIRFAPTTNWKEKAWNQLLKQNSKDKLKNNPPAMDNYNSTIGSLILELDRNWRDKVMNHLSSLANREQIKVFAYMLDRSRRYLFTSELKELVFKRLSEMKLTKYDWLFLARADSPDEDRNWILDQMFKRFEFSNMELIRLMKTDRFLYIQSRLWKKLVRKNLTKKELIELIAIAACLCSEVKEAAAIRLYKLFKHELTKRELINLHGCLCTTNNMFWTIWRFKIKKFDLTS